MGGQFLASRPLLDFHQKKKKKKEKKRKRKRKRKTFQ